MWENPKHIIVPVFFNYRGTALFHDDPVMVKANPNSLQKFMGLFNQKYLPTDEIRYQKHFYYGFEFNPREVKATQCLMGGVFDFFHARGLTFNYPDISNRKGTEIWVGEYKCHLFDIMADIRNQHLCDFGYFDPKTGSVVLDDNMRRSDGQHKSTDISRRIVRDSFLNGKILSSCIKIMEMPQEKTPKPE
ncbi:hypothetical protein [Acetobacter syzygii]|uniref:Uncharacterized protein n=1 Tax=Acetobacter syzygii TaxID=146476 RepID=A0A270BWC1_9PROT|nr:hypothetical protein [Acetobacter syzygii]NSL93147.1 hypothetical protein [Acetobacter syzygii]PAL26931.1 hypothetical protein B9K04_04050 [Acetobacter syzygii]PAL29352.1 hypothetical protein B9K05_01545 [Acetobacter syzygii]GAN71994.1 hypothetical protein Absy_027_092 [Acetobacter syzygii]GBR64339.1 hypothetical protein AA0483_1315 [Acetobacter syzygii NRIC 0483]